MARGVVGGATTQEFASEKGTIGEQMGPVVA
jgi:hypothetical protein